MSRSVRIVRELPCDELPCQKVSSEDVQTAGELPAAAIGIIQDCVTEPQSGSLPIDAPPDAPPVSGNERSAVASQGTAPLVEAALVDMTQECAVPPATRSEDTPIAASTRAAMVRTSLLRRDKGALIRELKALTASQTGTSGESLLQDIAEPPLVEEPAAPETQDRAALISELEALARDGAQRDVERVRDDVADMIARFRHRPDDMPI